MHAEYANPMQLQYMCSIAIRKITEAKKLSCILRDFRECRVTNQLRNRFKQGEIIKFNLSYKNYLEFKM